MPATRRGDDATWLSFGGAATPWQVQAGRDRTANVCITPLVVLVAGHGRGDGEGLAHEVFDGDQAVLLQSEARDDERLRPRQGKLRLARPGGESFAAVVE